MNCRLHSRREGTCHWWSVLSPPSLSFWKILTACAKFVQAPGWAAIIWIIDNENPTIRQSAKKKKYRDRASTFVILCMRGACSRGELHGIRWSNLSKKRWRVLPNTPLVRFRQAIQNEDRTMRWSAKWRHRVWTFRKYYIRTLLGWRGVFVTSETKEMFFYSINVRK